jgi:hypothetical protein
MLDGAFDALLSLNLRLNEDVPAHVPISPAVNIFDPNLPSSTLSRCGFAMARTS